WIASFARVGLLSIGLLAMLGSARLAWRREWLVVLTLAAGCAILCMTPWPAQFPRYLMPFSGPLATAVMLGVGLVAGNAKRGALAWTRRGGAALFVLWLLWLDVAAMRSIFRTRGEQP